MEPDREQAVLVCHHGAGYGALSFALLAREVTRLMPDLAIIAIDCRAHGESSGREEDLSLRNLVDDLSLVIDNLSSHWSAPHMLFFVGHSLGGSVIVNLATQGKELSMAQVSGLIVIDIVEETALRALSTMPAVLTERPSSFINLAEAIRWARRRRLNLLSEAAAISLPSQLVSETVTDGPWTWRVDLMKSRTHWLNWFHGLSAAFVACEGIPRLLVLAEREYLDRTLMIASMQGRFQTAIIRGTGHAIQEDRPNELASLIVTFVERNLCIARLNQRRHLDR